MIGIKGIFTTMTGFFDRERMEFAVIGAFGLHAYGYTRATRDIDFITRLENQGRIIRFLDSLGFELLQKTSAFSNHLHPLGSIRIDMMYVDGKTADAIFADIRKVTLFEKNETPVVSPEHLIALKLFAAMNDPQRKYREFADVQEIARKVDVDKEKVHQYFVKYGFEGLYEEIFGKKK